MRSSTLLLSSAALTLAACAPAQTQTTNPQTTPTQTPAPSASGERPVLVTPPQISYTLAPVTPPSATPTPADAWTTLPYLADKPAASYAKPTNVIDPSKRYRAVLITSKGVVTIELNPLAAPLAVNSFVFLALNHFYDGLTFHRVVAGFVAQGGDPTGSGVGGPGYTFTTETSPFAKFDAAGVLGMARNASRDSNGSQFFITLAPASSLDGNYTVFGKVSSGQNTVDALTKTENGSAKSDIMLSVTIQTLSNGK
ncbi:peptidylprolyl isomerase [Deinococcus sp.]|uniref:peptidylprolyl isomerase n=1 Tax=Deinococcus sp. TaxID=47478 RepID=UPI003CC629E9